jgi:hypothetical protein
MTGLIAIPNTGDFQAYQTVAVVGLPLSGGPNVMQLALVNTGSCASVGNDYYFAFTGPSEVSASTSLAN